MARQILTDYDFGGVSRATNLPPAINDSDALILRQLKEYTGGPIIQSYQVIAENYSISQGKNGISIESVTIAEGFTVTVPSGSTWRIL